MGTYQSSSASQTTALGARLGKTLRGGEVLAFTGGMGAGKTTFCTGLAKGLGSAAAVSSPTFSIANFYPGPVPFAHFDAWRISGPEDLETAGYYDYLDQGAVIAVEWSENVAEYLEVNPIRVDIQIQPDGSRQITIEGACEL